jgi:hypothetical protein
VWRKKEVVSTVGEDATKINKGERSAGFSRPKRRRSTPHHDGFILILQAAYMSKGNFFKIEDNKNIHIIAFFH